MLWLKRIACGIVALVLIFAGVSLIQSQQQLWQALGFCFFVGVCLKCWARYLTPFFSAWETFP